MAPTLAERRTLRAAIGWLLAAVLALLGHASAWAALGIDAVVVTNRSASSTSITSPALSTASGGELLLAFVATDARGAGMTVTGVTGGGLTWVLVRRTNAQLGTAEVWRAFATAPLSGVTVRANLSQSVAASLTVVGFTGADSSGSNGAGAIGATAGASANAGAPGASLVTTRDSSWVFGVGNGYDRAVARTLPTGQTLVSQYLATVGDTYWVQRQSAPTATAGTVVAINDTAPTNDRYNLSIVEVRATPPAGAMVFSDSAGIMTTPALSTTTPSDLLVAFVAYDGPSGAPQSANVSGAGLGWTLLMRSNAQRGTSEIWVARPGFVLSGASVTSQPTVAGFHGSLVVIAFTNAAGTGVVGRASAPTGAPDIFLPGISAGNWVFAVGNDWDQATGRTPVAGQVLVHQRIDSGVGDTFWVQSTATPSTANALVDIHDSAPTTDQWNYAAVEIVATRP